MLQSLKALSQSSDNWGLSPEHQIPAMCKVGNNMDMGRAPSGTQLSEPVGKSVSSSVGRVCPETGCHFLPEKQLYQPSAI